MYKGDDLTLYCSYHNEQLIHDYNLDYIAPYIKLFNTSNLTLKEDNINYLNPHLNEIVTIYYVWKNNLYSKYVGFCHYRRFYFNLTENVLDKCDFVYYMYIKLYLTKSEYYNNPHYKINDLYTYLKNLKIWDEDYLHKLFFDDDSFFICPWKISFILSWEKFVKFCEIYFGFMEYILGDFKDINNYLDYGRLYGWGSELWIGIIISLINNHQEPLNDNYVKCKSLLVKSNNIDNINLWIKKNNRILTYKYILTNLTKKERKLIYNSDCDWIIFIKDKSKIKEEYIELNDNEYIKCYDNVYFNKGIYTIENI